MLMPTSQPDDMTGAKDSDKRLGKDTDKDSDIEDAILASRILIVDDQAQHVHLLARLLQEAGYRQVTSTLDAREVAALHRKNAYDLILLDLQMPGLDGFGVMEVLRAESGDSCLPVIVLTAQPVHKLRALQAGARDFINKPFDTVEVELRIHHMLEVRLLHKRLQAHNRELERKVRERTAELQASEARFRSLTELAVDWYWEQNDAGNFTQVSGPVLELLGMGEAAPGAAPDMAFTDPFSVDSGAAAAEPDAVRGARHAAWGADGWDPAERQTLKDNIAARRPFLDFVMHCRRPDGSQQQFRISGQPMFDRQCRFIGYRGLGVEVRACQ